MPFPHGNSTAPIAMPLGHPGCKVRYESHPMWFMQALTTPVPKVAEIPQVHQLRPVTILPQLYRLWSRVVCRQLLRRLSDFMPPSLPGLLVGRGPLDAAMRQQFWLERAHHLQQHFAGLSLDLVKCFNTIHRGRVEQLLARLQIPEPIRKRWALSQQGLQGTLQPAIPHPSPPSNQELKANRSWRTGTQTLDSTRCHL